MSSDPEYAAPTRGAGQLSDVPLHTDAEETLVSMQAVVGRKWQPVIIYTLLKQGTLGFSSLKERIDDISSKMLSDSLDTLETAGLVTRSVVDDRPVRVEYALTDSGEALEPLVTDMIEWGTRHAAALDGRDEDDAADDSPVGTPLEGA